MKQKVLHINYPSLEESQVGEITAAIRDKVLEQFSSNNISFSFSSAKNSGYIMLYPSKPILKIRVSNHTPIGGEIEPYAIQTDGGIVTINAEAPHGQIICEQVLVDTLEQIKIQCDEMKANLLKSYE